LVVGFAFGGAAIGVEHAIRQAVLANPDGADDEERERLRFYLEFGHSRSRVPEWLHIGAYPHGIPYRGRLRRRYETPANRGIRCRAGSEIGPIAMQKVVGSNPLHFGRLALAGKNQTTPAYRLHFGYLFPK
jgi:hypothetical protein